jgi:tetratricopeptide (TPR) repeat protein
MMEAMADEIGPARRNFWPGAAALLALTVVVYLPTILRAGFIWDDPEYIVHNPTLRNLGGLWAIWAHPLSLPQYYPLVHTTFWIEYHLWGLHPPGYHADNVLLQSAAAILLWRALCRLGIGGCFLAAAIFAIHPVQVESVAWASERKNVLSAVFYLLSLHAYLDFLGARGSRARPYLLSLAFFVAALLSKSVACSLPAAILLILWWQKGKLGWRDVRPLAPFFLLGAVMAAATGILEQRHVGASGGEWSWSFADRCLIAGRAIWFYAGKLLWPAHLTFIYPQWQRMNFSQQPWLIAFPLSFLGVVAVLWLLRRRIGRGPLAATLFFAGTLLPALGFVNLYPMRYSFVADHFQYFACIGPIVLAAALIQRWFPIRIVGRIILVVLGILSWRQQGIYRDRIALWQDTIDKNPSSWMAWGNLGDEYAQLYNADNNPTDRAKARQCYAQLLHLAPDQPLAHWKWGIVMEYDNDPQAAQREFARAIELEPRFTLAMNSMALLLMQEHHPEQAMEFYRRAIALDPGYAEARFNYGIALEAGGDVDGAMREYALAAARRPDWADPQINLANLWRYKKHRVDLAIPYYAAAVADEPQRADLHLALATAWAAVGEIERARAECRAALQCDANFAPARRLLDQLGGG